MTGPGLAAVTGGTGFLGRYVVAALSSQGWRLRLLARGEPLSTWPAKAEVIRGDLDARDALERLVVGVDAVVHLAGLTKARNRAEFMAVNWEGTACLAAATTTAAPAARFVLVSSLAAREPGLSFYASSKRSGEDVTMTTFGPSGQWLVLRPGIIYGPGDNEGLALRRLAARAWVPVPRAPEPRLALVHAADVADAIAALCRSGPTCAVFEISDERCDGYGWRELLGHVRTAPDRPPRWLVVPDLAFMAVGAAADLWAFLSARPNVLGRGKVRELLHRDWSVDPARQIPADVWSPRMTLRDGMRGTRAWWASLGGRRPRSVP